MINKHTPAPWKALKHYNNCISVVDSGGFEIVDAAETAILLDYEAKLNIDHWAASEGAHRTLSKGEQAANSYLIAAAPELLEACRQIIWKLSHGTNENPNTISRLDTTVKMAIAAIKKAERL